MHWQTGSRDQVWLSTNNKAGSVFIQIYPILASFVSTPRQASSYVSIHNIPALTSVTEQNPFACIFTYGPFCGMVLPSFLCNVVLSGVLLARRMTQIIDHCGPHVFCYYYFFYLNFYSKIAFPIYNAWASLRISWYCVFI